MSLETVFQELSNTYFINGTHKASVSEKHFEVFNPANDERLGRIADCTEAEVDDVLSVSANVQKLWWSESGLHRAEKLHEVARTLKAMRHELATLMTMEVGKPYKESSDEVDWCVTAIDYYAEIGRHDMGSVMAPAVEGQFHYTIKEPHGVVSLILPFNFPYVLLCWEASAALASGNSVIVKPSEYSSLSTLKFMEAFSALPAGLVQCVTGGGRVGSQLCASDKTNMVAFTGSVPTGRIVAKACAETFKPHLIETSGNDPFIVMPSAPLDKAIRGACFAAFINAGQVCTSAERFFVHADVYDEFVEGLAAQARKLRIGNGLKNVDIGPMVNRNEMDRYEGIIVRAIEQGARVVTGAQRPAGLDKGNFQEPTVLADITPDMDIMNNESFGPVAPICKVRSLDEAIQYANDSNFGLGANLYSLRLDETMKAINGIETGMVWVNAPLLDNDAGPFGGVKLSGSGRQLGSEGLDSFRNTKLVMIDPEASDQDFWWFPYSDAEGFSANESN